MTPDRPPRVSCDFSWERREERQWERRDPLALPPISWGTPRLVRGLVHDRLNQQNGTWSNGPATLSSSFYSLADLESSAELDPAVDPPGPELLVHHPRPVLGPRPLVRRGTTSRPSRSTSRGDWWSYPSVPLYTSVYDRPQRTSRLWSDLRTPVSGGTGLTITSRSPPVAEVPAVGYTDDGARRAGSPLNLGVPGQEDTSQVHDITEPHDARTPRAGCLRLHQLGLPKCPPSTRTRPTCQPREETVWQEEDLVLTRPSGETLVFRLKQGTWR